MLQSYGCLAYVADGALWQGGLPRDRRGPAAFQGHPGCDTGGHQLRVLADNQLLIVDLNPSTVENRTDVKLSAWPADLLVLQD